MTHAPCEATAPGKIILFGEHAVVYGRPAIASPLSAVRARAVVCAGQRPGIHLSAPDLNIERSLADAGADDPFALVVRLVQSAAGLSHLPDLTITVTSQIPIASGLGSGAAITAAMIRALGGYLDLPELITDERVSALTYEVEKVHHGTPSGIDNTVVTYERPIYFVRSQPRNRIEPFHVEAPLHLLVADTGVRSSTRIPVGDVRRQWEAAPRRFEALFDTCGRIVQLARVAIETGDVTAVGNLMRENHTVLQDMTVSSPELDHLVDAALRAGAPGAKLSGAGRGGNMIALVEDEAQATAVAAALLEAGATGVLRSTLAATRST